MQPKATVVDTQIAIRSVHDRIRHDTRNFLRHDADIDLVTPLIAITIKTDTVVETCHLNDVPLQANVRLIKKTS